MYESDPTPIKHKLIPSWYSLMESTKSVNSIISIKRKAAISRIRKSHINMRLCLQQYLDVQAIV